MTKTHIFLPTAFIFAAALPWLAAAQNASNLPAAPAGPTEVQARFEAADKNGDGKVTREEAQASMPRVAMAWDKIDIDKKGYITLEQLQIIAANNR